MIEHARIHGANKGKVLISIRLCCYQNTHTLTVGEVDEVRLLGYGVDTIDLDNGHLVLVKCDEECGEVGHVDDPDHVRLAGLDGERGRCIVVDDCGVRDWFYVVRCKHSVFTQANRADSPAP